MQELNSISDNTLEKSIKQNVMLQAIEYVVAGCSIGGTVLTFILKDAIYSATPLTLAVCLNLFNRRKLDQLTRQHTDADMALVKRDLRAEIQRVRSQVEDLPAFQERSDYNDVKVSITSLSASVATLEQQMMETSGGQPIEAISAIEAELNQLREHQIDLTHSIEALQGQIPSDAESANVADSYQQELSALQDAVSQLSQQGGAADLEPLRAELQAMLAPVQQQVVDLSERTQESAPTTVSEEQLAPVFGQIEDVKVKMDAMLTNISEEMEIARGAMENTQHQVNEVQHQLSVVREEAANTPSGVNPDDLHQQIQAAITPLQGQIGQLESRITALPTLDANVTQAQEEQLQSLQHHLQDLSNRLETVSSQFSTEMANLPNMVDEQVQNRVGELREQTVPQVDEVGKQTSLSELDSLLADLS
ncbi:coiled-coil domain-containing protein [Acaryochloris marina]|uniref:Uncharacterized protein n=1 Tax=Acaryochloris marina (strain MBIC 11017) TaxID=329726 RepID=B0C219_ACAM1|nr:hypothetical protein [Acaryochloris marina]ABW27320.1 hypothetical protein AM1_2310 [Acaryochloris marina MBIC11017]BDM82063.1 hypothetical protein AM10699_49270 [Acaryochloris marina MBIC10699]